MAAAVCLVEACYVLVPRNGRKRKEVFAVLRPIRKEEKLFCKQFASHSSLASKHVSVTQKRTGGCVCVCVCVCGIYAYARASVYFASSSECVLTVALKPPVGAAPSWRCGPSFAVCTQTSTATSWRSLTQPDACTVSTGPLTGSKQALAQLDRGEVFSPKKKGFKEWGKNPKKNRWTRRGVKERSVCGVTGVWAGSVLLSWWRGRRWDDVMKAPLFMSRPLVRMQIHTRAHAMHTDTLTCTNPLHMNTKGELCQNKRWMIPQQKKKENPHRLPNTCAISLPTNQIIRQTKKFEWWMAILPQNNRSGATPRDWWQTNIWGASWPFSTVALVICACWDYDIAFPSLEAIPLWTCWLHTGNLHIYIIIHHVWICLCTHGKLHYIFRELFLDDVQ